MRRTAEDYLKTILLLRGEKGYARSVDIAERLGVTKPTVSIQVRRLLEEGLVIADKDHMLTLTDEGQAVAETVLERNVTFQQLLEELGVSPETAAADACKMEHAVSAESFAALKRLTEQRQLDVKKRTGPATPERRKGGKNPT